MADVGGDLTVESRQDTFRSRSSQVGGNVSVCVGLGDSSTNPDGAGEPNIVNDIIALPDRAATFAGDPLGQANQAIGSVNDTLDNGIGETQKTAGLGFTFGKGERDRARKPK